MPAIGPSAPPSEPEFRVRSMPELIVAAGGGFKQTLIDAGVGNVIAEWANGANISALMLGWLVAVGIRLATGSATVATITAAGDRRRVAVLLPCQRRRLLAGEGVLRVGPAPSRPGPDGCTLTP